MTGKLQEFCHKGHPLDGQNHAGRTTTGRALGCRICRHKPKAYHWWVGEICKVCGIYKQGTIGRARVAFLEKIGAPNANGCVLWEGAVSRRGYGQFGVPIKPGGKQVVMNAMRAAWILFVGEIPPNHDVCHKCDVPLCVRTSHLFLGTHKENQQDMVRKGRCKQAKVTADQVRLIRRLRASGLMVKTIAERVQMPVARVQNICVSRTWASVS